MSRIHTLPVWQRFRYNLIRLKKQRGEWICNNCGVSGYVVPIHLDHIKRLKDGGELLDPNNIQLLCEGCHIEKTAKENTKSKIDEKRRQWIELVGF